jgi:hypothetical protein
MRLSRRPKQEPFQRSDGLCGNRRHHHTSIAGKECGRSVLRPGHFRPDQPAPNQSASEAAIMPVDARPTIAAPDDDPYLWLEEIDGERALSWVDQQNRRTLDKFGTAAFAADRDTLAAILDRPDNIPFVTRRGPYLYNIWKDAKNPRGLWRRASSTASAPRSLAGRPCSMSMRLRRRKKKTGYGTARPRYRARTTWRSFPCHAGAATRRCCANSTSRPKLLSKTDSICRRPRAAPPGSTATRCCCQRLRARHGDHVGLLQDCPPLAARSARGSGSHPA